ncbi:glycosyltransferase involved in cell wall biosynthesis [Pedobacter cryoconitis]|uniref:glycosyltransferase family 2 protein n=1 Tax=Pedobacter cryoconitis TaxID=188932 RepID=UPI0016171035|nr:glycosyltransferase family 2 protein [Pedobacter cryoconitis]MBB6271530.1 glycosyltransferase involved in cell wall biosynthesis [Pedobacter cryoconitis]
MNQNNMPLLTIGLPFYNNQKTIQDAIRSVLIQTFKNWELILLDDGSTDNSYALAEEMTQGDHRVRLIKDGENKGLVSRLNQIVDLALGEYIARMDADDIMFPNRLEKQIQVFIAHPEIDIVATGAYTIDQHNSPVGIRGLNDINLMDKRDLFKQEFLIHPTIMVKRNWYFENRYDKDFLRAEDLELWCRSFDSTKFYRIREPLLFYREGNVNLNNYHLSMNTVRKIIKKHGPSVLTGTEMSVAIIKTHLKSWIYQIMGSLRLQYLLSSKRNNQLSEIQIKDACDILQEITGFDPKII